MKKKKKTQNEGTCAISLNVKVGVSALVWFGSAEVPDPTGSSMQVSANCSFNDTATPESSRNQIK